MSWKYRQDETDVLFGSGEPSTTGLQRPTLYMDSASGQVYGTIDGGTTWIPTIGRTGVEDLTATNTLTAADSGKVLTLNSATEFATTLPAVANGLTFTFIVKAAPSGADYTIVTASSANVIIGQVVSSDLNAVSDGDFETSGADTISFVSAKAVKGDKVELYCDGTNWYVTGYCSVFDAITFTTAS